MAEDPTPGPNGPPDRTSRLLRQPDYRRCLPDPSSSTVRRLGPPSATMDSSASGIREPTVDLVRSPGHLYVTVELPGASRETIDVEATDRRLAIEARADDGFVYRKEIDLPEAVDPDAVRAAYRNGVLDITIPTKTARMARATRGAGDA